MPRTAAETPDVPPIAELVAWLKECSVNEEDFEPREHFRYAADLIERAYPGPNTPGERRMGFTDDQPLLHPPSTVELDAHGYPASPLPPGYTLTPNVCPTGHVRVRVAVAVNSEGFVGSYGIKNESPQYAMKQAARDAGSSPTHVCIAVVDVPPCVSIPEVPAAVEEV